MIEHENIVRKLPYQVQNLAIKSLLTQMEQVNCMMKYLQRDDIHLINARGCFNALVKAYPDLSIYLSPNAEIVHNHNFINAVVKIQNGDTCSLSQAERKCVETLTFEMVDEGHKPGCSEFQNQG